MDFDSLHGLNSLFGDGDILDGKKEKGTRPGRVRGGSKTDQVEQDKRICQGKRENPVAVFPHSLNSCFDFNSHQRGFMGKELHGKPKKASRETGGMAGEGRGEAQGFAGKRFDFNSSK